MNVITAIVELSRASTRVLRRHPLLAWFPIFSLFALVAFFVLVGPILDGEPRWLTILGLLFVAHLVHVFFSVALTHEALKALRGDAPSVASGLATATSRMPSIVTFTVVTSTFGFLLALLGRSRSIAVQIARAVIGTAWSLATYLAIPVMVQERRGGLPSLRRSGILFRRTWGETALSEVGIRVLTARIAFVLVIVALVLVKLLADSLFALLLVMALSIAVIGLIGALEAIYRAALYVFASEGVVPEPFGGPELDAIWHVKPADPPPPEPNA
jgi:Ca2+/Na+ antiporter